MPEESPDNRQAGVEVSPEMIEAGTVALHESGWLEYNSPSDAALVEDILRAAMNVAGGQRTIGSRASVDENPSSSAEGL